MASQVPYSGTETVAPQLDPLPQVHVDTPIAAFGGATAGAITHMGEVAQGAGKELFDRAYAFQELHEQMKADSASADVFDQQTKRYLQFEQLKGAERTPQAYDQYVQDLKQIRESGAEGLNSPYAKMQYLRDSRRNESMMIWHGGVLAKEGMDQAQKEAGLAKIDAAWNNLATVDAGANPQELDRGVAAAKQATSSYVHLRSGFEPGTKENNDLAAPFTAQGAAKVVIARSNADPVAGRDLAKEMLDKGLLTQEVYDTIKPRLDAAVLNKTSIAVARNAVSGIDPYAVSSKDLEAQVRAAAEKADPGNKDLADTSVVKAEQIRDHLVQQKFLDEKQAREVLIHTIDGTNSPDGKVPISPEEAAARNPDFRTHYLNLSPESRNVVDTIIRHNQEIGGVVHNPTGDQTYYNMMQIYADRGSATPMQLSTLAEADLLKPPYDTLTRDQRQNLLKAQGEVINQAVQNPNMTYALTLGAVKDMLKDAQIDQASNKDEYAKFQTAYHDAVVAYGMGAERTVKNVADLTEIAKNLINKQVSHWYQPSTWNVNTAQPYQSIIDYSAADKTAGLKAYMRKFGHAADLSDESQKKIVNDFALRLRFNAMGKNSQPATSGGPASP